jgi:hypothetical protein
MDEMNETYERAQSLASAAQVEQARMHRLDEPVGNGVAGSEAEVGRPPADEVIWAFAPTRERANATRMGASIVWFRQE